MDERQVVVVGYPGAELLDIACVTTTFAYANRGGASPGYRVCVVSRGGRPIMTQSGLTLEVQGALERVRGPFDTLVVSGGDGHTAAAEDTALVGHVRRLARESRRIASVCTGATVLAAAGLLDGRRATTHWMFADALAAAYPAVRVDAEPVYVRDGDVTTGGGVSSALDLALSFVEEDHGARMARGVARGLVTYLQRPGNQAQMSMFVSAPAPDDRLLADVVGLIGRELDGDLGVTALAAGAGVSERQLTRLFVRHLGQSPARYVRTARLEAAAQLLVTTTLPLARVAARCGFTSAEVLRQAFADRYGVSPSHYRATQTASFQPSAEQPDDDQAAAERDVEEHAELRQ